MNLFNGILASSSSEALEPNPSVATKLTERSLTALVLPVLNRSLAESSAVELPSTPTSERLHSLNSPEFSQQLSRMVQTAVLSTLLDLQESIKLNEQRNFGRQVGGAFGMCSGAFLGGVVGTILAPGMGTWAGAGVGGFLGNLLGGAFGAEHGPLLIRNFEESTERLSTKFRQDMQKYASFIDSAVTKGREWWQVLDPRRLF